MILPNEDKDCYATESQRRVLVSLIKEPEISTRFFLTGGTALSVFYYHHRISNDLDLFSRIALNFSDIIFMLNSKWPKQNVIVKSSSGFISCLIQDVKVDFVYDPLSFDSSRYTVEIEKSISLTIDTVKDIASNKLGAMISRSEPKDFIDFYTIRRLSPELSFEKIYEDARKKDAIFDDPPTAAFQLEENLAILDSHPEIIPKVRFELDYKDFINNSRDLVKIIYAQFKPISPKN